jgi:hypothetical protein
VPAGNFKIINRFLIERSKPVWETSTSFEAAAAGRGCLENLPIRKEQETCERAMERSMRNETFVSEEKMALLSRAFIRRSAISAATRLAVMAAPLMLQNSSGARLDAPGAGRSSGIQRAAQEGPLLVSFESDRPARAYLDLAVRAYQRQQRHHHCRPQAGGAD